MHSAHAKNDFYKRSKTQNSFVIIHYAGEVSYDVRRFLEKNKDVLSPDIAICMTASGDPLVLALFAPEEDAAPAAGGRSKRKVRDPTAWTITRHDGPNHLGL